MISPRTVTGAQGCFVACVIFTRAKTARGTIARRSVLEEEKNEPPELIGKLWGRLRKERDLELHVRVGWQFGTEYLQLLDFQPSTGTYENAVLVERRLLGRLLGKLTALHRYSGGTAGSR